MARLIKADELIHSVCRKCNDVNYDEPCEPSDCAFYYAIHNAPTVDAVEVVHGRWYARPHYKLDSNASGRLLKYCDFYYCSECGAERPLVPPDNYCPNCGAKMDRKDDT